MSPPPVAVCIPWRERFPADRRLLSWVVGYWSRWSDWPVVVQDADWTPTFGDETPPPFNRSAARNACARRAIEAGARVLIFANADTIPVADRPGGPDELDAAVERALADPDGWDLSARYVEARQGWTESALAGPPLPRRDVPHSADVERSLTAAPGQLGKPYAGLIVVPAVLHERVGGWDEGYGAGWGWEDTAYVDSLAEATGQGPPRSGTVVHLWHERRPEDHPAHPEARRNRARWQMSNRGRPAKVRRSR